MIFKVIYLLLIFIITGLGIWCFVGDFHSKPVKTTSLRFKENRYSKVTDYVKEKLKQDELDELLRASGLKITSIYYNLFRYGVMLLWFILFSYSFFILKFFSLSQMLFGICFFVLTMPKVKIFDRYTPFYYFTDFFTKGFKAKKNKEIYRALMQLNNFVILHDCSLGADFIITEIMKFSNITKPIFSKMLSIWHLGRREEACTYFASAIGTKEGRDLSNIFLKLDVLNPAELKEQVDLYRENIKSEKRTERERRNERNGNILYGLVILSALVVILNFLIVSIFIDLLKNFNNTFIGGL